MLFVLWQFLIKLWIKQGNWEKFISFIVLIWMLFTSAAGGSFDLLPSQQSQTKGNWYLCWGSHLDGGMSLCWRGRGRIYSQFFWNSLAALGGSLFSLAMVLNHQTTFWLVFWRRIVSVRQRLTGPVSGTTDQVVLYWSCWGQSWSPTVQTSLAPAVFLNCFSHSALLQVCWNISCFPSFLSVRALDTEPDPLGGTGWYISVSHQILQP